MRFKNLNFSFFNKIFLFLVFFTLPFQTSKFFFLSQSYIFGIRKDLLAPAFYLKYVFILGLLLINFKIIRQIFVRNKKHFFLFFIFLLINFLISVNKTISAYKIFQILLLLGFCIIVYHLFRKQKQIAGIVINALLYSALIELFLAFYQVTTGVSFQNIFYFLGERRLDFFSPSVAKTIFFDRAILRAYGTFSHPNSLAGFYLLVYFLTFKKFFKNVKFFKIFFLRLISSFLIFLSFSKVAIFVFWILNIFYLLRNEKCNFCKLAKFLAFSVVSFLFFSSQFRYQSIFERQEQIIQAKSIFLKNPFLGVGFGAYLTALAENFPNLSYYQAQPVHNLFLLFLAEGGIIFWMLLFYFLLRISLIRRKLFADKDFLFILIFTSLFDHYWWSLPQNFFSLSFIFF